MRGAINRPGKYVLDGHAITVKMAVAAASYTASQAAIVTLHRQVDNGPEKIITINLNAVFDGTEPDRFLQDNDLLEVRIPK
jgi:hypothetical protein